MSIQGCRRYFLVEINCHAISHHLDKRVKVHFPFWVGVLSPIKVHDVWQVAVIAIDQVVKKCVAVNEFTIGAGIDNGILIVPAWLRILRPSTLLRILVAPALFRILIATTLLSLVFGFCSRILLASWWQWRWHLFDSYCGENHAVATLTLVTMFLELATQVVMNVLGLTISRT